MRSNQSWRAAAAISLSLAFTWPGTTLVRGQGPPISSGSGSGTGTGMSSSSFGATGTGSESSTGLGSTGTGRESLPANLGNGDRPGPGRVGDLTRPMDRNYRMDRSDPNSLAGISHVDPQLLNEARANSDPGERALALTRIAQTAIFSKQLEDAHKALIEAAPAALAVAQPLIREQRTIAVIDTLLSLAEERMAPVSEPISASDDLLLGGSPLPDSNKGSQNPGSGIDPRTPIAALPDHSRQERLQAALPEWAAAIDLARQVVDSTARTEAIFRIVESEAFSSQRVITDPIRSNAFRGRPDPATQAPDIRKFSDDLLARSADHASLIERPIWRNYAIYSIVSNAAASGQFRRGFEIARAVDQPEARTNVLIRLAEGQAINGQQAEATAAYAEAARAVAMIPQTDPRETLVGVLVDSLVSFGRFEDARSCIRMYVKPANQVLAFAAVAESQGRRGLADSAREWIAAEIAPTYQAMMYRKVNDGVLASIEQNRSKDLSRSN